MIFFFSCKNVPNGLILCPICHENMKGRKPRGLACFHSLCESCADEMMKTSAKSEITCPSCRAKTSVPDGSVSKLPLNFYLENMEIYPENASPDKVTICTACRNENQYIEAVSFCEECELNFCLVHRSIHIEQKISSHHKLTTFKREDRNLCFIHKKLLKYSCEECNQDICAECVYTKQHMEHIKRVIEIKEGIEMLNKSISADVDNYIVMLENKKTYLQHVLSSIKHAQTMVEARVALVTEEVQQEADSIQSALKKRNSIVESQCKNIDTILLSVKQAEEEFTKCREICGSDSYTELHHAKTKVNQEILKAKAICNTLIPSVKFDSVENKYKGLGKVTEVHENPISFQPFDHQNYGYARTSRNYVFTRRSVVAETLDQSYEHETQNGSLSHKNANYATSKTDTFEGKSLIRTGSLDNLLDERSRNEEPPEVTFINKFMWPKSLTLPSRYGNRKTGIYHEVDRL